MVELELSVHLWDAPFCGRDLMVELVNMTRYDPSFLGTYQVGEKNQTLVDDIMGENVTKADEAVVSMSSVFVQVNANSRGATLARKKTPRALPTG